MNYCDEYELALWTIQPFDEKIELRYSYSIMYFININIYCAHYYYNI